MMIVYQTNAQKWPFGFQEDEGKLSISPAMTEEKNKIKHNRAQKFWAGNFERSDIADYRQRKGETCKTTW